VVVVDDEPLIREGLGELLAAEPEVRVVAACADGASALAAVRQHAPDVLFLDVQMPGMDGIAVARALAESAAPPAVVFATAHERYAVAAFEVSAVDYLLKPFDASASARACGGVRARPARPRASARCAHSCPRSWRGSTAPAAAGEPRARRRGPCPPSACWWTSRRARAWSGSRTSSGSRRRTTTPSCTAPTGRAPPRAAQSLEARLDPARFARVHRSAIVNLTRVRQLRLLRGGDYALTMRSGAW
jgi:two-component system LytT family response regulator